MKLIHLTAFNAGAFHKGMVLHVGETDSPEHPRHGMYKVVAVKGDEVTARPLGSFEGYCWRLWGWIVRIMK